MSMEDTVLGRPEERVATARTLLGRPHLEFLGSGGEGVVLTDGRTVLKVFDGWPESERAERARLLSCFLGRFEGCRTLIPLQSLEWHGGLPTLVYRYAASRPWSGEVEGDLLRFLAECWHQGVVYNCVNPTNFRVFSDGLKLIDYGSDLRPFTVKDWVYMARRAFLSLRFSHRRELKALLREALLEWELPELDGFCGFLDSALSASEGEPNPGPAEAVARLEEALAAPSSSRGVETSPQEPLEVSLVLKASFLEGRTLEHQLRHLLAQLKHPRAFYERLVVLDSRPGGFVRQFGPPDAEAALAGLGRLLNEGRVDRVLVAPTEPDTVRALNLRWFGVDTPETHAASGVPVAPQLFGFEEARGRYVLQVDSDAIVCRREPGHDYLADMVAALRADPTVVSVGFNIAHASARFTPYDSPGEGHFVPEVRCCLFDRERFLGLRPFPNQLEGGRLARTWYRAVQDAQRQRGLRSVRGGDGRTFYIHPPNAWKPDAAAWFDVVDRVSQGYVTHLQFEQVDLRGTPFDWALPARTEEHLFLLLLERGDEGRFPLCWRSLVEQSRGDWGAIVLDTTDDESLRSLIQPEHGRVTWVRNPFGGRGAAGLRRALDRFCALPHAVVVPMRASDVLLGSEVLTHLRRRLVMGHDYVDAPVLSAGRLVQQGVAFRRQLLPAVHAEGESLGAWVRSARLRARAPTSLEAPLLERRQWEHEPSPDGKGPAPAAEPEEAPAILPAGLLARRLLLRQPDDYLLFVRHAEKAAGSRFEPWKSNQHRALSRSGEDECGYFARALTPPPDLIVCSPLERTWRTAKRMQEALGDQPSLRSLDALTGGRFEDHARWLALKRELGWEALVRRWMEDQLPSGILTPYREVIDTLRVALAEARREAGAKRVLVVTQGYVNTGLFHHLHGRTEFTGGPLFGFLCEYPAGLLGHS